MPPVPPKVLQCGATRSLQGWSTSPWEQGPLGVAQRAGTVPERDPELRPELPGRQRRLRTASDRPVPPGSPFSRTESSRTKPHVSHPPYSSFGNNGPAGFNHLWVRALVAP